MRSGSEDPSRPKPRRAPEPWNRTTRCCCPRGAPRPRLGSARAGALPRRSEGTSVVEPRRTGRRRVAMPKRPRVAAAPPRSRRSSRRRISTPDARPGRDRPVRRPGGRLAPTGRGADGIRARAGREAHARRGRPEGRPARPIPPQSARPGLLRAPRRAVWTRHPQRRRAAGHPPTPGRSRRTTTPWRGHRARVRVPRSTRPPRGEAGGPRWDEDLRPDPPDVPRGGGPARAPSGGVGTRRRPFRPPRTSAVHPTRGGGRSRERSYASSRGAAEAGHRGAPFHRDGLSATRTVTGRVVSDPSEPSPSPGPGSALTFEALLRRRVRICTAMSPSPWTLSFHGLCAPSWSGIPNRYAGPGGAACGRQDRVRELPREARGAVHERSTRKEARRQRARDGRWARPEGQRFRRAPVGRAPARPAASIPCAGPVPTPGPRANAVVSSTRRAVDCSSEAPRLGRRERRRAGSAP